MISMPASSPAAIQADIDNSISGSDSDSDSDLTAVKSGDLHCLDCGTLQHTCPCGCAGTSSLANMRRDLLGKKRGKATDTTAMDVEGHCPKTRRMNDAQSDETESVGMDVETPCLQTIAAETGTTAETISDTDAETPCLQIEPTEAKVETASAVLHVQSETHVEILCSAERYREVSSLVFLRDASERSLEQAIMEDWPETAKDVVEIRKVLAARGFEGGGSLLAVLQKPTSKEILEVPTHVCGVYYRMLSKVNGKPCYQMVARALGVDALVCRGVYIHWSRCAQNMQIGSLDATKRGLAYKTGYGKGSRWYVLVDRARLHEVG